MLIYWRVYLNLTMYLQIYLLSTYLSPNLSLDLHIYVLICTYIIPIDLNWQPRINKPWSLFGYLQLISGVICYEGVIGQWLPSGLAKSRLDILPWNLNWRYLPYIRSMKELCQGIYPQMWLYMIQYPQFRYLKWRLMIYIYIYLYKSLYLYLHSKPISKSKHLYPNKSTDLYTYMNQKNLYPPVNILHRYGQQTIGFLH